MARLGKINFVQVAEPQPLAVKFDDDGFRTAFEQLCFDLRICVEHAADDFGGTNHGWNRVDSSNLVLPLTIRRTRIFAKREENRVTQGVLVCPAAELDARN